MEMRHESYGQEHRCNVYHKIQLCVWEMHFQSI